MQAHSALLLAAISAGAIAFTVHAQPLQSSQGDVAGIGPTDAGGGPTDGPDQWDPIERRRVNVIGDPADDDEVVQTGGPSFGNKRVDADAFGDHRTCPNRFDAEPLLTYDVSGATLAGLYHLRLSVSSNGAASVAKVDSLRGSRAAIQMLDPLEVDLLHDQLLDAGAAELCDDTLHVIDAPIVTLTVFQDDGSAHSANYFREAGVGDWQAADEVIQEFLLERFPELLEE